jgi:hypothetical protein
MVCTIGEHQSGLDAQRIKQPSSSFLGVASSVQALKTRPHAHPSRQTSSEIQVLANSQPASMQLAVLIPARPSSGQIKSEALCISSVQY